MCGINGIYAYAGAAVDRSELMRVRDRMAPRGPDGFGEWIGGDGRIGLGHRRLAIIDLSDAGAQPMVSGDGRYVVTFNGEVYNYESLRDDLIREGAVFRSHSDTEVLLELYARKGEAMVRELRGMFAFAIWDTERRTLFLARDPYGIKPLYYAADGKTFRFASQVKALLAGGTISHDPDPAGSVGFYIFGSVPEPYTMFSAIRALPAGSTMLIDARGAGTPRPYFSLSGVYSVAEKSGAPPLGEKDVAAHLLDSVRHHLVADVPVGAFLSSGIDSGALVGLMRDAGQQDIQTVTIAFEEFGGMQSDESGLAAVVAAQYGARHRRRVVTQQEFEADLPRILDAMDQPSIDGFNTWFASKAAREAGLKVAVSGLGGDELLGGYSTFTSVPRMVRAMWLPSRVPLLPALARMLLRSGLGRRLGLHPKAAGLLEYGRGYPGAYLLRRGLFMPWELSEVLDPGVVAEGLKRLDPVGYVGRAAGGGLKTAFARIAAMEAGIYMRNQLLRDSDWASMAHGLELRVPLVDSVLLERTAAFGIQRGPGHGKQVLAAAPSRPLPDAVVNRPKTGFSIPTAQWVARIDRGGGGSVKQYPTASEVRTFANRMAATSGLVGAAG